MPERARFIRSSTAQYRANDVERVRIPRGEVIREFVFRLEGQLTVAGANNVYANVLRGDALACIRNLRITRNTGDVIFEIDGPGLVRQSQWWYGRTPRDRILTLGAGGADPSFDTTFCVPMWLPRTQLPRLTALDGRVGLSNLDLEVEWGSHTSIIATATGFTTNPTLKMYIAAASDVQVPVGRFGIFERKRIVHTITAANPRLEIELPTRHWLRGFGIIAVDDGVEVGGTAATRLINNFKWRSGQATMLDVEEAVLREMQANHHASDRSFSGTAYDDDLLGDNNNFEGVYWYDHLWDGNVTEMFPAGRTAENVLELDVSNPGGGTNQLHIYPWIVRANQEP